MENEAVSLEEAYLRISKRLVVVLRERNYALEASKRDALKAGKLEVLVRHLLKKMPSEEVRGITTALSVGALAQGWPPGANLIGLSEQIASVVNSKNGAPRQTLFEACETPFTLEDLKKIEDARARSSMNLDQPTPSAKHIGTSACECGAFSAGHTKFKTGHSSWCPFDPA